MARCLSVQGYVIINQLSPNFFSGPIGNNSALVQLMARCRAGANSIPEPMLTNFINANMSANFTLYYNIINNNSNFSLKSYHTDIFFYFYMNISRPHWTQIKNVHYDYLTTIRWFVDLLSLQRCFPLAVSKAARTTSNRSYVTTNCRFYSDISQILLLYKTWGIITHLTPRSRREYITDMSKYHNLGIRSRD